MRICLDTNVLLRLFSVGTPLAAITKAVLDGHLELACSNEILLEWEEMATRLSGVSYWLRVSRFLEVVTELNRGLLRVEPTFRFGVIATDPDDNKSVDCAIVANADFILTEDRHFAVLAGSGYRPQPISPQAFIDRHLLP